MAMKTPEDTINFLLACIEKAEKIDFQAVAVETGLYKGQKEVLQAIRNIRRKYTLIPEDVNAAASPEESKAQGKKRKSDSKASKAEPKTPKKRAETNVEMKGDKFKEEHAEIKTEGKKKEESNRDELVVDNEVWEVL